MSDVNELLTCLQCGVEFDRDGEFNESYCAFTGDTIFVEMVAVPLGESVIDGDAGFYWCTPQCMGRWIARWAVRQQMGWVPG